MAEQEDRQCLVGLAWGNFNDEGKLCGRGAIESRIEDGYYLILEYHAIQSHYSIAHLSNMLDWCFAETMEEIFSLEVD